MFRIFILSPARLDGPRVQLLFNPNAKFELASRVQREGAPIGEIFSFLSGLYFRGKLAYATHFAKPSRRLPGVLVITSGRGLLPVDTIVSAEELRWMSEVRIELTDKRYLEPLRTSAQNIASKLTRNSEVVLLGSIGTKKYVDPLTKIFDNRIKFPIDFVGRGDMSRGGLLLRCIDADRELPYAPILGAVRHGERPPKLEPRVRRPIVK